VEGEKPCKWDPGNLFLTTTGQHTQAVKTSFLRLGHLVALPQGNQPSSMAEGSEGSENEHAQKVHTLWLEACAQLSLPLSVCEAQWCDVLVPRYTEHHRHYHTMQHLVEMCMLIDAYRTLLKDLPTVVLAALFHDVIYDVPPHSAARQKSNEEESARVFEKFAECSGLGQTHPAVSRRVAHYIRCTEKHKAAHLEGEDGSDLRLFLDFDLAVLGSAPARYSQYARQIRAEYAGLPDAAYTAGRAAVLRTLACAGRVFLTDAMEAARGQAARDNIAGEQAALHRAGAG